ncbi:MAG: hypothetical protein LBF66_02250 [Holosporales bacterium]|jgi:hypothetical protein|nr:hypothetical protein [Holosporales bacterium]
MFGLCKNALLLGVFASCFVGSGRCSMHVDFEGLNNEKVRIYCDRTKDCRGVYPPGQDRNLLTRIMD